MRTRSSCGPGSFQIVQDLVDALGDEVLVIHVVDHQHRRVVACRKAFFLALQVDASVGRALAGLDAELLLDPLDDGVRPAQHARDVGAHRDVMAADRLGLEHGIKGRHLVDLYRGQAEILGHRVHERRREVAVVLVLHGVQRRDHRRALAIGREFRNPAVDLLAYVLREAHRSISPNTMSWVPITATTSASMWPRTISSSAARCAKPGARTLSRYGLFAPCRPTDTPAPS